MANRDEIICNCMQISRGEIEDAIKNGNNTVEKVQDATEAGTVCGVCVEDIEEIIEEIGS